MTGVVVGAIVLVVIVIVVAVIVGRRSREKRLEGRRVEATEHRELSRDRQLEAERQQAEADERAAAPSVKRRSPNNTRLKHDGTDLKPMSSRAGRRYGADCPTTWNSTRYRTVSSWIGPA